MAISKLYDAYAQAFGADSSAVREQTAELTTALDRVVRAEGAEAVQAAVKLARDSWIKTEALLCKLAVSSDDLKISAKQGREELEHVIRDRPLVAVSLAAAAGFALAFLVRR